MITLNSGHTIPTLGIGTWKSDPEVLYNAIKQSQKHWMNRELIM